MTLLDTFKNKYIIKGIIIAETPLHIGNGKVDFSPVAIDNSVIRDRYGNPFIPGSTLKGVIRSNIESILNTGIFENYKACDILGDSCISDKSMKEYKDNIKDEKLLAEKIYENQCDVCKLFGGKHFASKLNIYDASICEDKVYTQIRDGIAIDRDTLIHYNNAKFTFETVSEGSKFKFEMTIDNLCDNQKLVVKLILKLLEDGDIRVGGKTSVGMGKIRLINKKVYYIDADDKEKMKDYFLNGLNEEHLLSSGVFK